MTPEELVETFICGNRSFAREVFKTMRFSKRGEVLLEAIFTADNTPNLDLKDFIRSIYQS